MTSPLANRVAVVTGASKGIGAAIAATLAAAGASVVVNYNSSRADADKVVAKITAAGGRATAIGGNVSNQEEIVKLFNEAEAAYGKIDILVNNAGIYTGAPLGSIDAAHFHKQFDLNVLGLILCTQEALKHFSPDGGTIINVSSVVAKLALPGLSVYNATKAAVDSLTRTFSVELEPKKIRVNSVNPGLIVTEGTHAAGLAEGELPPGLGQRGEPHHIADAVLFLASDASSWMNGQTMYLTGSYA